MSFAPDCQLGAEVVPAVNFEPRRDGLVPDLLLIHYTGLPTLARSLDVLTRADCRVSCHYLVGECGRIIQMVPESARAWHAGVASWAGRTDINSCSIGIEIQNPGHSGGMPDYGSVQIDSVIALCRDILARHAIEARRVLAHSDVAPLRKIDPGEYFPWQRLAEAGVGVWLEATLPRPEDPGFGPLAGGPSVTRAQQLLSRFGYGVAITGEMDPLTVAVLAAFQRHFRTRRVDGRLDASTLDVLERLVGDACKE